MPLFHFHPPRKVIQQWKSSLTGVPTLQSVCLTGMSTFQWCPPYKDVHLTGVSAFQGCHPYRGIFLSGASTLQGFTTLHMAIRFRKVSALNLSQLENKNVTAVYSHNYLW